MTSGMMRTALDDAPHDDYDDACNEDDANCHDYCTCLMEMYIVNSVVGNLNTYQNFELLRLSHISVV